MDLSILLFSFPNDRFEPHINKKCGTQGLTSKAITARTENEKSLSLFNFIFIYIFTQLSILRFNGKNRHNATTIQCKSDKLSNYKNGPLAPQVCRILIPSVEMVQGLYFIEDNSLTELVSNNYNSTRQTLHADVNVLRRYANGIYTIIIPHDY